MAFAHVGDEAAALLVEADQNAAFLHHQPHRQPGAVAVVPGRAMDRRQHHVGAQLRDMHQRVFKHPLLRCHLRSRLHMLHRAAAAHAEMRAARGDSLRRGAFDGDRLGKLVGRLAHVGRHAHPLTRQRAIDEQRLAVQACDAAAVLVQGLDLDERQRGRVDRDTRRRRAAPAERTGGAHRPNTAAAPHAYVTRAMPRGIPASARRACGRGWRARARSPARRLPAPACRAGAGSAGTSGRC